MLALIQIQDSVMYLKIFIFMKFHISSVPSFLMKLSQNWMSRDTNSYCFRHITKVEFKNLKLGGTISSIIGIFLVRFRIIRQMLKIIRVFSKAVILQGGEKYILWKWKEIVSRLFPSFNCQYLFSF